MKKRRPIPLATQLDVALRQLAGFLGAEPGDLQLDHRPALNFRPFNDAGTDTVPPANSAEHLAWIPSADHKRKTFGAGGTSRISTRGSDISEPRRLDKIAAKQAIFRERVLAVEKREKPPSKWPKRKFGR